MENKKVKLKEVVKLVNGYPFKPVDWGEKGIEIIRIQNLNNPLAIFNKTAIEIDDKYLVREGDILISWSASLGVYEWKKESAYLNQHIFKVEFITNKISKDYFRYVIQLAIEELTYKMRGVGLKHLTKAQFDEYEFVLPDLVKQTEIINKLNNIESLIVKRKRTIELLKEYISSTFYNMFGPPISSNKKFKFKKLSELVLNKRNAIKAGPFGSELKKEFYVDNGYKVYGQEQVIRNDFNYGDYFIDDERYEKLKSCKIESGDILISLVGTLGKVAIVPENFQEGIINPRLIKISINNNLVNPFYIKSLFETNYFEAYLKDIAKGGAVQSLNVSVLKGIDFPIPRIDLQNKYCETLKKVEIQIQKCLKSLSLLEEIFQSILYNSFNNEKVDEDEVDKIMNDDLEVETIIGTILASDFESLAQYNVYKNILFKILDRTEKNIEISKDDLSYSKGIVQVYSNNKISIKTLREHKLDDNEVITF
ncbi:restriction endonuclease subunit S [Flavobacterium sp. TR2]|uniref:restriction endonuclease subunit S n=1 Tax=Flavobacterium sp. TR2 TaxID=2977321 RepID=UPI0021B1560C|nr:restriction endonuclease subunit S [Flavobacterium sp. TR2]UWY27866.1 restriction endonuclease subunit S [Flavobacterium sp. TR2]